MIQIGWQLKGIEEAILLVGKVRKRYAEMEKPFKKASVIITASIDKNFIAQGRPNGWVALAAITLLVRRQGKGKGAAKILQNTGRLRQSITPYVDVLAGMFGASTNVEYAQLMNFGGKSEGGTVRVPEVQVPAFKRLQTWRTKTGSISKFVNVRAHKVRAHDVKLGPRPVPARPFMLLQTEDLPRIRAVFKEYLDGE